MRNRYRRSYMCVAFMLASVLSLLAQSDRIDVQQRDDLQLRVGDASQSMLAATLVEAPVIGGGSSESELPEAPSATRPDMSTADPAVSPAVKRESHGAPAAAMGGPFGVDRTVADRNYSAVTAAMFGASIANAELTMHCLGQHSSCNDVPNLLSRRVALYGIGIPADLGVAYLTYYMKRRHSRIWYVPAACVTAANIFLGVRVYRWAQQ